MYTLAWPDGTVFYVGKGCGDRVKDHEKEARKGGISLKCDTIRTIWEQGGEVQRAIVFRTNNEQEAFDQECALIRKLGPRHLTNQTGGGGTMAPWNFLIDKSIEQMTEDEYRESLVRWRKFSIEERAEKLRLWRSQRYDRLTNDLRWLKLQRRTEEVKTTQIEIDRLRPLVVEPLDYETG